MRIAIIDDNPVDRVILRTLLSHHDEVEIVGEADDLATGQNLLHRQPADVVFLDVQLGCETGFQLLATLPPANRPAVVFCTLHLHYAAAAFDANAVDYLVKPILPERLARTLQRLQATRSPASRLSMPEEEPARLELDDLVSFKNGDERRILAVSAIALILSERDYTRVQAVDGHAYLDPRRLRDWQRSLPSRRFQMLDRSTIVNLSEVISCRHMPDGGLLTLRNSTRPLLIGHAALRRLEESVHSR